MLYDVQTPEEYFAALKDDWRKEKLLHIHELIKSKGPNLKEGIEYKMLSYGDEKESIFNLNAQKNYVSLYVGHISKVDPDGELLKGASIGKGCIRFKKTLALSDTRVDEFIERALQLWYEDVDFGC